jgi:hypothetical protein
MIDSIVMVACLKVSILAVKSMNFDQDLKILMMMQSSLRVTQSSTSASLYLLDQDRQATPKLRANPFQTIL